MTNPNWKENLVEELIDKHNWDGTCDEAYARETIRPKRYNADILLLQGKYPVETPVQEHPDGDYVLFTDFQEERNKRKDLQNYVRHSTLCSSGACLTSCGINCTGIGCGCGFGTWKACTCGLDQLLSTLKGE